jgi:hypothetical protein
MKQRTAAACAYTAEIAAQATPGGIRADTSVAKDVYNAAVGARVHCAHLGKAHGSCLCRYHNLQPTRAEQLCHKAGGCNAKHQPSISPRQQHKLVGNTKGQGNGCEAHGACVEPTAARDRCTRLA